MSNTTRAPINIYNDDLPKMAKRKVMLLSLIQMGKYQQLLKEYEKEKFAIDGDFVSEAIGAKRLNTLRWLYSAMTEKEKKQFGDIKADNIFDAVHLCIQNFDFHIFEFILKEPSIRKLPNSIYSYAIDFEDSRPIRWISTRYIYKFRDAFSPMNLVKIWRTKRHLLPWIADFELWLSDNKDDGFFKKAFISSLRACKKMLSEEEMKEFEEAVLKIRAKAVEDLIDEPISEAGFKKAAPKRRTDGKIEF